MLLFTNVSESSIRYDRLPVEENLCEVLKFCQLETDK